MNLKQIKRGSTYNYSKGDRSPVRAVIVLSTAAKKASATGKRACNIPVRFLDDESEALVGTKGIKPMEASRPAPTIITKLPGPVILCFKLDFKVAAQNAGVIDAVLELLKGEGTVELKSVSTL